jgi:hypothetical protein
LAPLGCLRSQWRRAHGPVSCAEHSRDERNKTVPRARRCRHRLAPTRKGCSRCGGAPPQNYSNRRRLEDCDWPLHRRSMNNFGTGNRRESRPSCVACSNKRSKPRRDGPWICQLFAPFSEENASSGKSPQP